jgi:hypothetical protein
MVLKAEGWLLPYRKKPTTWAGDEAPALQNGNGRLA